LSLGSGDVSKENASKNQSDTRQFPHPPQLVASRKVPIDAIYRRAADLMRIDEALLRHRGDGSTDLGTEKSLAEQLQLVHYNVGQVRCVVFFCFTD
jgi:hypothetical protein